MTERGLIQSFDRSDEALLRVTFVDAAKAECAGE
jgi:hypothetical protein